MLPFHRRHQCRIFADDDIYHYTITKSYNNCWNNEHGKGNNGYIYLKKQKRYNKYRTN